MSVSQIGDNLNSNRWIEFVGGPFDGHWQSHHSPISQLARDIVWLVTEDAFRQLARPRRRAPSQRGGLTSVALYELDVSPELPHYRYAGSIGAERFSHAIRNLN